MVVVPKLVAFEVDTEVEPADIFVLFPRTLIAGYVTVTVTLCEFEQPLLFVSVTVYVVVTEGLTLGLEAVEVNPEGLLVQL